MAFIGMLMRAVKRKKICGLRVHLPKAVMILALVSVSGHSSQEVPEELVKHPNVLFISLDDMNDWVGTLAGHAQTLTPSLDRFAESGVNFTRNYTPSPGCNPSRSAMLTGLHTYKSAEVFRRQS